MGMTMPEVGDITDEEIARFIRRPKKRGPAPGAMQKRRAIGQKLGRTGKNHTVYLTNDVWEVVEGIAKANQWTDSLTVDIILTMFLQENGLETATLAALTNQAERDLMARMERQVADMEAAEDAAAIT